MQVSKRDMKVEVLASGDEEAEYEKLRAAKGAGERTWLEMDKGIITCVFL